MSFEKSTQDSADEEKNLEKMYGPSHADFHNRVASLQSKNEAISIKQEIERDKELTKLGREDLMNDLEITWEI